MQSKNLWFKLCCGHSKFVSYEIPRRRRARPRSNKKKERGRESKIEEDKGGSDKEIPRETKSVRRLNLT